MKIATFTDTDYNVVSFYKPGVLRLFEKRAGKWSEKKQVELQLDPDMNLPEVRVKLRSVASQIDDCKIFLAGEVKGVPYAILEGMGFNIWKSEGPVMDQLDFVAQKEKEAAEAAKNALPKPQVIGDIRDGYYRLNMIEAQASCPGASSQQILIPFMEQTVFSRLEVIFDHPPRWLGAELTRLKLKFEAEALDAHGHDMKVIISPKE